MAASEENTNDSLIAIGKLLGKLTTKSVPTWDIGENEPIKSHIRNFENAVAGAAEMTDVEKANELILTMRGGAAEFIEELPVETKNSYNKLKDELLQTFHKEKTIGMLIKDFNSLNWKKNKQTIREFAAVLSIQWRKIEGAAGDKKKNDKCSQALLKNRLLEGIKEADAEFGSNLQFIWNDSGESLKELATQAEIKYDQHRQNAEQIRELQFDNEPIFLNYEKRRELYNGCLRNGNHFDYGKNDKRQSPGKQQQDRYHSTNDLISYFDDTHPYQEESEYSREKFAKLTDNQKRLKGQNEIVSEGLYQSQDFRRSLRPNAHFYEGHETYEDIYDGRYDDFDINSQCEYENEHPQCESESEYQYSQSDYQTTDYSEFEVSSNSDDEQNGITYENEYL